MKLPVRPPDLPQLLSRLATGAAGAEGLNRTIESGLGPAPGGRYRHWDTFRHAPPLPDVPVEEQWAAVKLARRLTYHAIPLVDAAGNPFRYALPNVALEMLHHVDRDAAGSIRSTEQVTDPATRDAYLFKSIVEEAITSSQLEGASTTRKVAKAMIQEGRAPRTRSERMIVNNYHGMRHVLRLVNKPLVPRDVLELQRILTEDTLDDPGAAGRFRTAEERIVVEDETGIILHTPPGADELEQRMRSMCEFANGSSEGEFIHPVARAILLHFWLAYDHPFVDGNGRTARALFYWSMASQGYWLCEYVSISRILKKARSKYARSFLYTESDDNDATYFILYQLGVLSRAIEELHQYLTRKAVELRKAEELVRQLDAMGETLNHRQIALINHALKNPDARYTVGSHKRSHGVVYETARSDLAKLLDLSLLEQRKSGRAFVYFPSPDLRAKLEGPTLLKRTRKHRSSES